MDIPYASCSALHRAYGEGGITPLQVAEVLLERIEKLDPLVNGFVYTNRDATLAMASASTERWRRGTPLGALDGVPVSIKDLIAVAGWPLVRGSLALRGSAPPAEDAPSVLRLREAGAVFLGKTATPESGCKIVTRSAVHGVTRNPYDLERTPGGSSGGAATAVALGMGPLALGTDGAGSIRIPAAWTGLFGLKPSFGRVPSYPPSLFMPHSVQGPMTRDVESARLMLEVIARPEPRDPYALAQPFDATRAASGSVAGLRIGVTHSFGLLSPRVEPALLAAVDAAAEQLKRAGARVADVTLSWPCDPYDPFIVFWEATYAGFLTNTYTPDAIALMDPDLRAMATRGASVDIVRYHKALMQRMALAAHAKTVFREFDLLLGPVMPCGPPELARDAPPDQLAGDWRWCPFTYLWNMTAQPAASVPWGQCARGLPIGVQLVASIAGEPEILRAATVLERVAPKLPAPQLPRAAPPPGGSVG